MKRDVKNRPGLAKPRTTNGQPRAAAATEEKDSLPDAAWFRAVRRRLLAWFASNARDLPWRRTQNPYRIWLSEIMLQQTQVATVKPYFDRFVEALPTIETLAAADEQQVLRLWEGLGYYRRARQLHQAARILVAEHNGCFPRDPLVVRGLPGIGRYTAGAILSIAFDAREPILEANTARLWARLLAYRGDPTSADGGRILWAAAEAVLPQTGSGTLNQALMELGSMVCTPKGPRCDACPAAVLCRARAAGLQAEIPATKPKRPSEARREAAVLVHRRGRLLLIRQPDGRRWAGLWDFPRFQIHAHKPAEIHRELIEGVANLTGLSIRLRGHRTTLRHGVTRFRITLLGYDAEYVAGPDRRSDLPTMRWLRPAELDAYPLSTTGRKLLDLREQ
jgi:A/G-specific adenine glycosylase